MKYQQLGQSMVEYTIVSAALISAFFWGANTDCAGYDNCVSKLLTTMHDTYDGYSSSIASIQKYGDYEAENAPDDGGGGDGGDGGDDNNDGSGGTDGSGLGSVLNPDGIAQVSIVRSPDGATTYGFLRVDGSVVDADGNVIGLYDASTETLITNDGDIITVDLDNVIVDEEGNVLHIRAVTACAGNPPNVYAWGYVSKASGKVFNSTNQNEMENVGHLCSEPSFKIVNNNGEEEAGRILNGQYYAVVFSVNASASPLPPTGEVVYWEEIGLCSVMAKEWDDDVDTNINPFILVDPEDLYEREKEIYDEQFALIGDSDKNLGEIDAFDYLEQTTLFNVPVEMNDCPSARIFVEPTDPSPNE